MGRVPFDRLHTVCLTHESRTGYTEVCREPDGTLLVRLRIRSAACQRELLSGLDESVPVRLESGVLEVLLPCREGISLRQWLYEQKPDLAQRRDACLSLLEQQVEGKVPPCLIALSANTENLIVTGRSMSLQYLPELRQWEPDMEDAQAVCAVAAVISEVLSEKVGPWRNRRISEELLLLTLRQEEQDYSSWGQLQRDVAAIPDAPPRLNLVPYRHIHAAPRKLRLVPPYPARRRLAAPLWEIHLASVGGAAAGSGSFIPGFRLPPSCSGEKRDRLAGYAPSRGSGFA